MTAVLANVKGAGKAVEGKWSVLGRVGGLTDVASPSTTLIAWVSLRDLVPAFTAWHRLGLPVVLLLTGVVHC